MRSLTRTNQKGVSHLIGRINRVIVRAGDASNPCRHVFCSVAAYVRQSEKSIYSSVPRLSLDVFIRLEICGQCLIYPEASIYF